MCSNQCIHFLLPFESWPGLSFSIPFLQIWFTGPFLKARGVCRRPELGLALSTKFSWSTRLQGHMGERLGGSFQHSMSHLSPLARLWLFPKTSKVSCRAENFLEPFAFFFFDLLQGQPAAIVYFLRLILYCSRIISFKAQWNPLRSVEILFSLLL